MIDDRTWLRAVRMVRKPGMRRNEYDVKIDDRFAYNPKTGWVRKSRPMASNPQLQVLGDWTRRNPDVLPNAGAPLVDFGSDTEVTGRKLRGSSLDDLKGAVRKFHGKATGDIVSEFTVDDGKDDNLDLAYLGHVPAVAWLSKKTGSSSKQIDVNGELVRFHGFRNLFRGQSRPILALHTPTNEAVIVQGSVESLRDRCDDSGILGFTPVVEYIVEAIEDSTKGEFHYVHEFKRDAEPVLRWNNEIGGLVFDRDRTLVAARRKNTGFVKEAVYEVTDWFKEKGEEDRHA